MGDEGGLLAEGSEGEGLTEGREWKEERRSDSHMGPCPSSQPCGLRSAFSL